jgi:hypothetical protein
MRDRGAIDNSSDEPIHRRIIGFYGPLGRYQRGTVDRPWPRTKKTVKRKTQAADLSRAPHEARDLDHALELAPLLVLAEGVAVMGAGEAALG